MQERTATSSLPPELLTYILGFHHDDRDALLQYALVSKAWIAPAQIHIFRSVTITEEELQAFLSFIDAAPYVRPYIVRISIDAQSSKKPITPSPILHPDLASELPPLQELDPVQLHRIISLFLHLETIELRHFHLRPGTEAVVSHQNAELGANLRLKTLLVGHCSYEHPSDLLEILRYFESIDHLYIVQNLFKTFHSRPSGACLLPSPLISNVTLEYLQPYTVLNRISNLTTSKILQVPGTTNLQSLHLTQYPPWATLHVERALEVVHPRLKHLSLDFRGLSEDPSHKGVFSKITRFKYLQSVSLRLSMDIEQRLPGYEIYSPIQEFIRDVLSSLHPKTLKTLRQVRCMLYPGLQMSVSSYSWLVLQRLVNWAFLNDFVNRRTYLEKFEFEMCYEIQGIDQGRLTAAGAHDIDSLLQDLRWTSARFRQILHLTENYSSRLSHTRGL
ncbi:hypothetical protein NLI96_g3109 [Meripilus lineatus]|uniref:F-box domain-containing protein n=1 Tax=Meripilus lineatus TaxID=2056292 RepID=A0AAD5V7F4_9APHY|nr:hypothetical protein NLI96_g3109 [Physisporinus lineatus]